SNSSLACASGSCEESKCPKPTGGHRPAGRAPWVRPQAPGQPHHSCNKRNLFMKRGPSANKFGEFIFRHLRGESTTFFQRLARGHWKAPADQEIQKEVMALSPEQIALIRRCLVKSLGAGLHRFLFALGEAHDFDRGITVVVDGIDVVDESDGLHGESFGPDGWMAKYARHPEGYPEFDV